MTSARAHRYTAEDDATILYLLRAKKTAVEIGEIIGRTKNSVIGRVRDVPELREVGFRHSQTKPRRTEPAGKRRYVRGGKPNMARLKAANARPVAEFSVECRETERRTRPVVEATSMCDSLPAQGPSRTAAAKPRRIPLMDLDWQDRRWPVEGAGEHTLFCGLSKLPGCSYCREHYARSVASAPFLLDAAA